MNSELSIISLVINATPLVQAVMLILILASLCSWGLVVQRWLLYRYVHRHNIHFEDQFWSGGDLAELFQEIGPDDNGGMSAIFHAGYDEFSRLRRRGGTDSTVVMEGVQRAMRIACAREEERLEHHLPFLATVGSTCPYIGLLGTVWGIMNAFRSIAGMQQATLAVVAPGISEALIATAMGLFAAIPAVIAYNRFVARVDMLNSSNSNFAEEFTALLHRRLRGSDTVPQRAPETTPAADSQQAAGQPVTT